MSDLTGKACSPNTIHWVYDTWMLAKSTGGAMVLGIGYTLIVLYLLYSVMKGPKAPMNPWGATGLEWKIQSPPITHNFHDMPEVTEEPYDYQHAPAPQREVK